MYSLFVCGVTHNSRGFEYNVIEGSPLPDGIGQYIDIYDKKKMKDGRNYVLQKLIISDIKYVLIAEYVRINPSDKKSSRGSYIAVGVLTNEVISSNNSYVYRITSIQDLLKRMRNERNAFHMKFKIKSNLNKLNQHININELNNKYDYILYLEDVFKVISRDKKCKKIIFNNLIYNEKMQSKVAKPIQNKISIIGRIAKIFGMR